jgi:hypothetical protein
VPETSDEGAPGEHRARQRESTPAPLRPARAVRAAPARRAPTPGRAATPGRRTAAYGPDAPAAPYGPGATPAPYATRAAPAAYPTPRPGPAGSRAGAHSAR